MQVMVLCHLIFNLQFASVFFEGPDQLFWYLFQFLTDFELYSKSVTQEFPRVYYPGKVIRAITVFIYFPLVKDDPILLNAHSSSHSCTPCGDKIPQ